MAIKEQKCRLTRRGDAATPQEIQATPGYRAVPNGYRAESRFRIAARLPQTLPGLAERDRCRLPQTAHGGFRPQFDRGSLGKHCGLREAGSAQPPRLPIRSEEHTSELQS